MEKPPSVRQSSPTITTFSRKMPFLLSQIFHEQEIQCMRVEKAKLEESLRAQECSSSTFMSTLSHVSLTCRLDSKITHLEQTVEDLRAQLADSQRKADAKDGLVKDLHAVLRAHERQHHCKALYAQGRMHEAVESLIKFSITGNNEVGAITDWVSGEFCVGGYNRVYSIPPIRAYAPMRYITGKHRRRSIKHQGI